jgi:hypothetical protein
MGYGWLSILSAILSIALPIALFAARHWIVARISKGVQHQFDREIEQLRTELRKAEEEHRSQLRSKEADIAALRNIVLSGSAGRQALLDKRRFEAVEKVWVAVNDLAQLKTISSTMATLNYKEAAKLVKASDPKIQQLLSTLAPITPSSADFQKLNNAARDEQPFLTEPAWAYFWAYKQVLYMNHVRFTVLKDIVAQSDRDPESIFLLDSLRNILKAALPHQSKFIDQNDPGAWHYLLDELENCLLAELKKILDGKAVDQLMTERAKAIMDAVKEADKETARKQAEEAIPEELILAPR